MSGLRPQVFLCTGMLGCYIHVSMEFVSVLTQEYVRSTRFVFSPLCSLPPLWGVILQWPEGHFFICLLTDQQTCFELFKQQMMGRKLYNIFFFICTTDFLFTGTVVYFHLHCIKQTVQRSAFMLTL